MLSDLFDFIAFYVCYVGIGIVWMAIPAFLVYPLVCRLSKGEWHSLYSWIDLCSLLSTHVIWAYGFLHDFSRRGAGRILDIVIIEVAYGVMVFLRIPFVWRHPEWRTRMAVASLFLLNVLAISVIFFFDFARVE